jgi:hypothetical protein
LFSTDSTCCGLLHPTESGDYCHLNSDSIKPHCHELYPAFILL